MTIRPILAVMGVLLMVGALAGADKKKAPEAVPPGTVIRTETKLVLVDTVVTDKKGNYVRGLTAEEFRVWEDNKEQTIKSFSSEADAGAATGPQTRYMVLFFDNSNMDFGQQAMARKAAFQFIDGNAGPDRKMAIVNYGGSLQVTQNFTSDAVLLKSVVSGIKIASLTGAAMEAPSMSSLPQLGRAASGFGARSILLALKSLAKNMGSIPGRKLLILFTSGFKVDSEMLSEVTAAIDACNRANIAIYPVDARGLVAITAVPVPQSRLTPPFARRWTYAPADTGAIRPEPASFTVSAMRFAFFQRGAPAGGGNTGGAGSTGSTGSTGGGGGGRGGGGMSPGGWSPGMGSGGSVPGGRGPGSGTSPMPGGSAGRTPGSATTGRGGGLGNNVGLNRPAPSILIPAIPSSISDDQQVLMMLASGTGGFVIRNTNDLAGGLEKIAKELNHYYILGYTPPETVEGSCHTLKVKLEGSGNTVRARSGYCNTKPKDLLAGNSTEKELEVKASLPEAGKAAAGATMRLPHFYTSANVARVNVALDLPPGVIHFAKEKGKFRGTVTVVGIAFRQDGSVAARFSDAVKLEFEDKGVVKKYDVEPAHYDNQFEVGPGTYNFRLLYGAGGQNYGKVEMPLVIEPYTEQQFAVSGLALSKKVQRTAELGSALDSALLEDRTPLVYKGMQVVPSSTNRFKKTELAVMYFEIYEPFLTAPRDPKKSQAVAIQIRVLDRNSGKKMDDSGLMRVELPATGNTPMVPIATNMSIKDLAPGTYTFDLLAVDSTGKQVRRATEFVVE